MNTPTRKASSSDATPIALLGIELPRPARLPLDLIDWDQAFDAIVSDHYPDDARSRIIAEAQAYLGRHPGCSPEGCVDEAIGAGRWR